MFFAGDQLSRYKQGQARPATLELLTQLERFTGSCNIKICLVTINVREEGLRAFWKGGVARKMRAAQFGLTLFTYEVVQRLIYVDFGGSRYLHIISIAACFCFSGPVDHRRRQPKGLRVYSIQGWCGVYRIPSILVLIWC